MKTSPAPLVADVQLFEMKLTEVAILLEPHLNQLLPKEGRLAEAMRYAVLGNGKRFRPFLVLQTGALFAVARENLLNTAAAIECLHCYSLVHDDLPAMDDDDLRRGKPTVHKVFGEGTAILAGDALQTLAFEIMANESAGLVAGLARASGWAGMAGGQQYDLETTPDVARMSSMKTGALIRFSILAGATLGNASSAQHRALEIYGEQLGLAFQISDDLMDTGRDATAGKRTFVTELGMPQAKQLLVTTVEEALGVLGTFGTRAQPLRDAAHFMLRRAD